jgi:hypothetical protein
MTIRNTCHIVSSAMTLRVREEHENRVFRALPYSFRRFSRECARSSKSKIDE